MKVIMLMVVLLEVPLIKMIEMANLENKVKTDYLGDTNPVQKIDKIRGKVFILDTITGLLNTVYNISNP